MGFSSFRIGVLIRVIIISLTTFLLVYLVSFNEKYVSAVIVAGAILIEIIELFRYTTVTNKKLQNFSNQSGTLIFHQALRMTINWAGALKS